MRLHERKESIDPDFRRMALLLWDRCGGEGEAPEGFVYEARRVWDEAILEAEREGYRNGLRAIRGLVLSAIAKGWEGDDL